MRPWAACRFANKLDTVVQHVYVALCLQKRPSAGAPARTNPADGGAVMLVNSGPLLLTSSTFSHNAALGTGSYGGALLVRSSRGAVEISRCSFTNNSAELEVRQAGF
jgi:hypothetical protein